MSRRNPIHIVNWTDRSSHRDAGSGGYGCPGHHNRFLFSFGAYGTTHVMVFETSLERALELAADWLADNAPGHIMLHGNGNDKYDPELDALMAEACKKAGLQWPIPDTIDMSDCDAMQPYWDAEQKAYADLTYTERGYLTSYEWSMIENPDHATVLELAGDTGW